METSAEPGKPSPKCHKPYFPSYGVLEGPQKQVGAETIHMYIHLQRDIHLYCA